MADNTPKTRAGTKAQPFPWEEALEAQLGRTAKRLTGLVTDPKQELLNITRQYLPSPTDSPEERDRKLEELALGLTGTPIKGVKPYGVAQEGAFYRVSPEIARRNAARTRGNLESGGEGAEVAGGAPRGDVPELFSGQTYQELTGSQNFPLEIADEYTRRRMSRPYSLPSMSESSLAKQSAIGKTFELAATDNPKYKKAVFAAYKKKYPKIVEQANAKDYDDLVEKSYQQMAKETEEQFRRLPINMSYHRAGEGNYRSSAEMLHDVHKNRHLYVFQGGDPHDFLNKIDPDTGLNTNEMFRAVHDFFGHAVHGTQFGPKGEELAWLAHSQMYSPLARLAMTSETRGQNSFGNYTPINAELKKALSSIEEELYEARRRGRNADVQRLEQLKSALFNEFQFAPNKALLLPPEFTTYTYEGGMPSYIQPLIEPKAGTTTQTPLTHFSTSPDILMTDPRKYGTGIAGEEAARLEGVQGAVRPRTYFYAGEPGAVTPEAGLGPYRYRAEGESLYNLAEDPLSLRTLATEANRIPFTARANAGLVRGQQAMADLERMIKEYGYEGYLQPGGSAPAAAVFTPKAVQRKANGGLATGGQAFPLQEEFQAEVERRAARPRTRAGVPVEDTNVLGGALRGLANTLGGLAFGRTVGTLGMPADILEPTAAPGAMIPMFGMAGMPSEISKALVQRFAPKGPDIPAPTSEYLLEKGLEKFKPPQEFEVSAKLGRFMPFDIAEMEAAGRKLKALQPTFTEMMETGLERATAPARMYAAPEDGAKLSKEEYSRMMREKYAAQNLAREEKKVTAADLKPQEVKVPADELGFYSPAEKAAANLKRNIGTGEAFLSDLRKAPDVGETDLIHTGLENWLKGKKTVSKQEIQDYMTKNRLKLQKEELRAGEGNPDDLRFRGGDAIHDTDYINMVADDYINDWDSIGYRTREEIRNEKLRQYTPEEAEQLINSGQLDEMVDEEIRDLAYRLAEDQYYDNPYREWDNDLGYSIFGNDDVGYSIRDPRGNDITPRRGIYDFETAEGTVQQHAMENGYVSEEGTQYHDYQLEGPSTNYREHLTRLSRGKARTDLQEELADVRRAMDNPRDQEDYNALAKRRDELEDELSQHHKPYESSHWPGDDVVSHSRTQDRVDVEGKDTLHIDELQSDWHQDGAEFGYADKATRQQYKDLMRERAGLAADFTALRDEISVLSHRAYHNDTMKQHAGYEPFPEVRAKLDEANQKSKDIADKIDEINMRLSDIEKAVPDAPFKKDWVEKELKKLLKVAAEEGKERITLSRWQDQLRRWGTDSIGFKKTSDGVWSVTASKNRRILPGDLDDTVTADEIYYKTSLRGGESPVTSKSELRKIVKMDLSKGWSNAHIDRVTNKVWDQMNKLQIDEVGAIDPRKEGFKATYGKSFIDTMQKLAKKLGAKTGTTELDIGSKEYIQVPYIEVSGKAKQSAIKGQPYKAGGAVRKADGGAVHPAVEKFAASLPHPAVNDFMRRLADGGAIYNTIPDVSDAEKMLQGPAF